MSNTKEDMEDLYSAVDVRKGFSMTNYSLFLSLLLNNKYFFKDTDTEFNVNQRVTCKRLLKYILKPDKVHDAIDAMVVKYEEILEKPLTSRIDLFNICHNSHDHRVSSHLEDEHAGIIIELGSFKFPHFDALLNIFLMSEMLMNDVNNASDSKEYWFIQ